MSRTIALDIGNTHLGWGVFEDGEQLVAVGKLPAREGISLPPPAWQGADAAAVASVNTEGLELLEASWNWSGAPPLTVLGRDMEIPVPTRVRDRSQVGSDRLVNTLAWTRRSSRPAVVVDFGTAVTLDIVAGDGAYCGGLILPGPEIIAEAMHSRTSLLPHVDIVPTPESYGTDTASMMRRGTFGLICGGVAFHVAALRKHLPSETVFVATGGGAPVFTPWILGIDRVVPHLTVHGVCAAYRSVANESERA